MYGEQVSVDGCRRTVRQLSGGHEKGTDGERDTPHCEMSLSCFGESVLTVGYGEFAEKTNYAEA